MHIIYKRDYSIKEIPGYDNGLWWVQDFSVMLPIYLLENFKNKSKLGGRFPSYLFIKFNPSSRVNLSFLISIEAKCVGRV